MPKEKINLTLDPNTLVKAHVLSNLFHGSNISALVTSLVNNCYVQNRAVITDDDVKEAQSAVDELIEKRGKNKNKRGTVSRTEKTITKETVSKVDTASSEKTADDTLLERTNELEKSTKSESQTSSNNDKSIINSDDVALLDSILLLKGYSIDNISEEQRTRLLNIVKVPQFTFEQKITMVENFIGILPKNSNNDEIAASIETAEKAKDVNKGENENSYTALILDKKNTKGISKYLDD